MKKIYFLLIFVAPLILFYKAFFNFFAADDFFVLKISTANSPKEFLQFFSLKETYGDPFFRPLTNKIYPYLVKSIFNLNPLPFHFSTFALFIANAFLVFKIIDFLTKNEKIAIFSSFLFSINASNFLSLYWITLFEQVCMTTFFFLTIYLYLKKSNYALVTFCLALLSREGAISIPFVLLIISPLFPTKKRKSLLPFFVILFFYLLLRIGLGYMPTEKNYILSFSPKNIFNNFFWYILWSFGLPEMLLDFIGPGLKINPNFVNWYLIHGLIFLFSMLILIPWFLINFIQVFKLSSKQKRPVAFFIFWFVLTIGPALFFSWHKFTYYLTVPLLGFVGLIAIFLIKTPKLIRLIIVSTILILSFSSINLNEKTHWVIKRAKIAHSLIKTVKEKYPSLPKGASLYLINDPHYPFISKEWGSSSTQAHHALSGESAFQVFYNDYSLKVYFEDLNLPPPNTSNLHILEAVIPN